jgi:hypothetical protein
MQNNHAGTRAGDSRWKILTVDLVVLRVRRYHGRGKDDVPVSPANAAIVDPGFVVEPVPNEPERFGHGRAGCVAGKFDVSLSYDRSAMLGNGRLGSPALSEGRCRG